MRVSILSSVVTITGIVFEWMEPTSAFGSVVRDKALLVAYDLDRHSEVTEGRRQRVRPH